MQQGKKVSKIFGGVGFLALSSFLAKIIGAIYRIPLTNIIGVEGIGQYQLVFPLYALLIAVVCGGAPYAVSRIVAYQNTLGNHDKTKNFIKSCLIFLCIISIIAFLFCVVIASTLATAQSNIDLRLCYFTIAPSIIFVTISHLIKGWFIGNNNMLPNSLSNLFEQVIKLILGLVLAKHFLQYGLIYSVVGALASITICELLETIFLSIWYAISTPKNKTKLPLEFAQNTKLFIQKSSTVTLSGLVFPTLAFADSILILKLLQLYGVDSQLGTAQYGLLTGPISSLVNLPVVISLALSIAIVPKVSAYLAHLEIEHIKSKTALCIQTSFLVCLPSFLGMFALAKPILSVLYPTINSKLFPLAVFLLQLQSIGIVFLSQLEIFNAVLQSLEKSSRVLINVCIGGVVKIILELILVPYIGIIGSVVSSVVFFGLSWLLNLNLYKKLVGNNSELFKNISKILVSGVIMALAVIACVVFIKNKYLSLIIGLIVGISIYFGLLILLKVIDKSTLQNFIFFKKIKSNNTPKNKEFEND